MGTTASGLSLKAQGNALFAAANYRKALEKYTEALQQDGEDAILFSNRAACHLKLGQAAEALGDAEEAVRLRPDWAKGHFRCGCALEMQGQLERALVAFNAAKELDRNSREIQDRLKQLRQRISIQQEPEASASHHTSGGRSRAHMGSARPHQGVMNVRIHEGPPTMPSSPASWAEGMLPAQQREWLVDCYRMRVDDDMACGGGRLHGLYLPNPTGEAVAEDFLVFCKLAVRHGVVPQRGWSWDAFLRTAARLLPYAFEKADAKEKWGGENVFHVMFGGCSLRATAELVMGTSCMGYPEPGEGQEAEQLYEQVTGPGIRRLLAEAEGSGVVTVESKSSGSPAPGAGEPSASGAAALFGDVGGAGPWKRLLGELVSGVARAGHWG